MRCATTSSEAKARRRGGGRPPPPLKSPGAASWRRTCTAFALRHLLRAQHFSRSAKTVEVEPGRPQRAEHGLRNIDEFLHDGIFVVLALVASKIGVAPELADRLALPVKLALS